MSEAITVVAGHVESKGGVSIIENRLLKTKNKINKFSSYGNQILYKRLET